MTIQPEHQAPPHPLPAPRELLGHVVAIIVAEGVVAVVSLAWLRLNSVGLPWWVYAFVAAVILGGYTAMIALQHFFHHEWHIPSNGWFHTALIAILTVIVVVPLAMMLSFTKARLEALESSDTKRADLYRTVSQSLPTMLAKQDLTTADLNVLFQSCLDAIYVTNAAVAKDHDLRAAAFYVNNTNHLFVPVGAHYGWALPPTIRTLQFDVAPRRADESDQKYCERLGVAGWSYANNKPVLSADVMQPGPDEHYCYRLFNPDQKEARDHAMICAQIPSLSKPDANVGVLCISSLRKNVFNDSDEGLVSVFAAGFAKFTPPEIEPPPPGAQAPQPPLPGKSPV